MTSHRHLDRGRAPAAASARDAAVRRMSRINRLVAGGAAVMAAGFATLAAQASSQGTASTATPASTAPTTTATSSYGTSPWQTSSAQTAAPAATPQAPVITSGGS